ncbi:hypothetical protein [Clostridium gasigenes]|uniref:hypothetical protein n=1 Tax=Clostridium gasigenes TaxID=94869 RepID=UPI001C0D0569|nr:hypothetical protein [Clostridium gasigenes]MBU3106154.1 hypothetical protein [Clostridium gasigenes]
MKLFKKCLCSVLLVTALLTSVQTTAHAATSMIFNRAETGTVTVTNGSHPIYDDYGNETGLYYETGESFYYDRVYSFGSNSFYASYVSNSNIRRYVMTSSCNTLTWEKRPVSGLTIE